MSNILSRSAWFLKYQPREIEDYIFVDNNMESDIKSWIFEKSIPGNLLLFGPPGCGKTSLAELLINKLLENKEHNLKIIKSRSVDQIDELYNWVQKRPVKDNKKIIYIEEFDRLSIAAMNQLKDTLLEKFQEHVSFICCTNYLNKIPVPIVDRFTYKYIIEPKNKDQTLIRIKNILEEENITYKLEDLIIFITNNYRSGLRKLINTIQINIKNKILNLENINIEGGDENVENKIINLTLQIFKEVMVSNINEKKTILYQVMSSKINNIYSELLDIIQYNHNIDWEHVYLTIQKKMNFIPLIQITEKYLNSFELKKIQYFHFMSFVGEGIETIAKINI